jgi:CRP-like cAMP-binding protein
MDDPAGMAGQLSPADAMSPHLLRSAPVFCGLAEPAFDILLKHVAQSRAPAGTVIVREGDLDNHLFLIAHGSVRVCRRCGQADEIEIARLGSGEFFGEMCFLEAQPRAATVQAVSDCVLFSLTSLAIYHLYEAMPAQHSILMVNIARDLSRRLRHLVQILADNATPQKRPHAGA